MRVRMYGDCGDKAEFGDFRMGMRMQSEVRVESELNIRTETNSRVIETEQGDTNELWMKLSLHATQDIIAGTCDKYTIAGTV